MTTTAPAGWTESAEGLKRTFEFETFVDSLNFVNDVGELAEEADHHPDIDIRYNKVTLTLITHSAGNKVTSKDRELAESIGNLLISE